MKSQARTFTTLLTALSMSSTFGCIDPWLISTVSARKSFRVPVRSIRLEAPSPRVSDLLDEQAMENVLLSAGMPQAAIDGVQQQGISLLDLNAVNQVYPIDEFVADIEVAIIDAMESTVEEAATEGDDMVTDFDSNWDAWNGWELDLERPDEDLEEALHSLPVTYRFVIEAESLDEFLGGDGEDTDDELDLLDTIFLREVGLRTLLPSEIEPAGGWSDEESDAVDRELRDPARVVNCQDDQAELGDELSGRITLERTDADDDPVVLMDMPDVQSRSVCGVLFPLDDGRNLKSFFEGPVRLEIQLTTVAGVESLDLGGYVQPGVEGTFRLPATLSEL